MTANDFEQFAEELTKPGEPTRVFGNHIRRIRNQGITWNNKVEMRKILEDWYVEEAYELTPDEAKKKIFDVSKKVGNMKSLFSEKRETVTDSRKDETDNTGKEETGAATVTITHVEGPLIIGGHVGTFVGRDDNSTSNTFNISSLDSHLQDLLTDGQKQFLEKHLKEESLTTLDGLPGTGMSLLKFDTILRSVCMIETPDGGQGTGFLTKISDSRYPGIAFMTAGHNFQEETTERLPKVIDQELFASFKLHFGHTKGTPGGAGGIKSCQLADFGDFRGSIGRAGERRFFPGNISERSLEDEDYCVLLFTDPSIEEKLARFGLEYLPCGGGDYLEKRRGILSIFGHPGVAKDHPNAPLRVSYGKEKVVSSFCGLPVHATNKSHLCYDMDTLPGNFGSPIIGRGANDPNVLFSQWPRKGKN